MHTDFSWLTVFLLAMGWATHWLHAVIKARKVAAAAGKPKPSLWSYWTAEPYVVVLSVIGVVVGYFVLPWVAEGWPDLAALIGSTKEQPLNPLAAYLGGYFMPSVADAAGRRLQAMIGGPP